MDFNKSQVMASICTIHEGLLGTSYETNKLLQVRTEWLIVYPLST